MITQETVDKVVIRLLSGESLKTIAADLRVKGTTLNMAVRHLGDKDLLAEIPAYTGFVTQYREIVRLVEEGHTIALAGRRVGLTAGKTSKLVSYAGIRKQSGWKSSMTEVKVEAAKLLLSQGVKRKEVAKNFGVSYGVLYYWIPATAVFGKNSGI